MQVKRIILLAVITIFFVSMLTGCPPQIAPAGDSLTAKEFWDIIKPVAEKLGNDVVPVYITGAGYAPKYRIIHEGKAYRWIVGLYSDEEKAVWEVRYLSYRTEGGATPIPGLPEKLYSDAFLTASDLTDWNIDSPEAYEIAIQNGAEEATLMTLQTSRLGSLADGINGFYDPELIPESTKLFWSIRAGDYYYIDACTGEYLGSYTLEQVSNMKTMPSTSP